MIQNTAIFYDIENLIGGYSDPESIVKEISLKDILHKIHGIEFVGGIGIQRAYANWSDPRLKAMGNEINQLGIEPIQVFGLSKNQKKNAADIQLAVDAVDLAYIRPWLDVFVIISGDGGFSALAKKLHECGRKVVGCAYPSATNQLFESVCDIFINLEEPKSQSTVVERKIYNKLGIKHPLAIKISKQVTPLSSTDREAVIEHAKNMINMLLNDHDCITQLNNNGINIGAIREIFKYAIEDFNSVMLGFPRFVDFFNLAASETDLVALLMPNNEMRVVFRGNDLARDVSLNRSEDLLLTLKITNPTVKRMTSDLERLARDDAQEIIEHSKRLIQWFNNDPESQKVLEKRGISLSVLKEAFKFGIEDFDSRVVGFGKFVEFLQYITVGTTLAVSRSSNNTISITRRDLSLEGLEQLPDLDESYIHSSDNYSAILMTGEPIFRVVNQREQSNLIAIILGLEESLRNRDALCHYLDENHIQYDIKLLNACITNLHSAEILADTSRVMNLSDLNLTVNPLFQEVPGIIEKILDSMKQKLLNFLGDEFQEAILEELINS